MSKKPDMKDKPYVGNYPPLKEWLDRHDARCNWQLPLGNKHNPTAYVESWAIGKGEVIVVVQANQHGWNLYTSERGTDIRVAFADAEIRLDLEL